MFELKIKISLRKRFIRVDILDNYSRVLNCATNSRSHSDSQDIYLIVKRGLRLAKEYCENNSIDFYGTNIKVLVVISAESGVYSELKQISNKALKDLLEVLPVNFSYEVRRKMQMPKRKLLLTKT